MDRENSHITVRRIFSHAVVLSLAFVFIGVFEIINNIIFKTLLVGTLPNVLITHAAPILFFYFLKSLEYVAIFLLFVVVTILLKKVVLMFNAQNDDTFPITLNKILTILYDLFIPLLLIYILFFNYKSGPATLSYYFYFLSDSVSPALKAFMDFGTLTILLKIVMSLIFAAIFTRFRVSRYARHYITFFLFLILMAVLPMLIFLTRHFSGVLSIVLIVVAVIAAFILLLFTLRRLFAVGIYRWAEIVLIGVLLIGIAGNVYLFPAAKKPHINIVHIILDTLRMKSFNEATMPFLYSLKDKGVYFPNSYASSDNTVTTHNAIYYGKHPSNVGLEHGPFPETTLMEVLRSHGYRTVVVSANGRFCIVNGFNKGVEDFYETWKDDNHVRDIQLMLDYGLSEKFDIIQKYLSFYTTKFLNKTRSIDKKPLGHREYRYFNYEPAEVVNEFIKHAVEKNPPSDPLYLFVNYLDPHSPYLAPTPKHIEPVVQRLKTDFPDIHRKLHFDHIAADDTLIFRQIMMMWQHIDSVTTKSKKDAFLTFCYEENLRYLDEQLREMFAWFEEQNLFDNTLFIITSDHGESLGEHDLYDHGNKRLYNPEIKVPLMMLFPDRLKPIVKRNTVDVNTQSVDFFPTFVDLLGINTDVKLSGESLLPFIFGIKDSNDNDYSIAEYTNVRAITDNHYKLIVRPHAVELYNIQDDPEEQNNIAAQMPQVTSHLQNKLDELLKSSQYVSQSRLQSPNDSRYDPETLKLLKTLGYVK